MSSDRAVPPSVRTNEGRYANFFQVGHNKFEVLIEFGQKDSGIHTRIYLSPHYARVLSDLLIESLRQMSIEVIGERLDLAPANLADTD